MIIHSITDNIKKQIGNLFFGCLSLLSYSTQQELYFIKKT